MYFGRIKQYILFGGGELLISLAKHLKQTGNAVIVVTSKRHSECNINFEDDSKSFTAHLEDIAVDYIISNEVTDDHSVISRITKETIGISFGAAWIFKNEFIEQFNGRLLNSHGSRLPQDRGGGGYSWRILRGDKIGMSLIHKVESGIDTGDIVFSIEYIFPETCTRPIDFQQYSLKQDLKAFQIFFSDVQDGKHFSTISQPEYLSTYWPRLVAEIHGFIDWSWSTINIERFICAFDEPYIGASTFINAKKVHLKGCSSIVNDGDFHPFQSGLVYRVSRSGVYIATEQGGLIIKRVLSENHFDITNDIVIGDRLYTPIKYLHEANIYRAIYTPLGLKK